MRVLSAPRSPETVHTRFAKPLAYTPEVAAFLDQVLDRCGVDRSSYRPEPLVRRVPKRGFHNIFRKEYVAINLENLAGFEAGAQVDPEILKSRGLVKNIRDGLKILGVGELKHALHVRAHKFSKSAAEKIQKVGGTIEVIV